MTNLKKTILIVSFCAVVIIIAVAWSASRRVITPLSSNTNINSEVKIESTTFNPTTVKVGDIVAGMHVVIAKAFFGDGPAQEENYQIKFSGETTVEGEYTYGYSEFEGTIVLHFTPSVSENTHLPHITRKPIFKLQDSAKSLLGLSGTKDQEGKAVVVLQNLEFASAPAEVENTAELVRVVSND